MSNFGLGARLAPRQNSDLLKLLRLLKLLKLLKSSEVLKYLNYRISPIKCQPTLDTYVEWHLLDFLLLLSMGTSMDRDHVEDHPSHGWTVSKPTSPLENSNP